MRKFLSTAAAVLALGAGAAHAGSLTSPAEPVVFAPAPAAPTAYSWTGGYAGLGLSYGRANHRTDTAPNFWPNGSGWGIGGLAGYNWQSGATVFGVEGHLSAQRMRGTTNTAVGEVRTDLTSLASIRGRVGVAADRTLFFITAGPAAGRVSHNAVDAGLSDSGTVYGMMVGVGVEQAMAGGWNLRGDLEHYRFRSRDFATAGPGSFPGVRTSANVARVSAVFRF
jgi:outer membrane immunogenic protein